MKRKTKNIIGILSASAFAAVTWVTVQGLIELFRFDRLSALGKVIIGSVILIALTFLVKDYLNIQVRR